MQTIKYTEEVTKLSDLSLADTWLSEAKLNGDFSVERRWVRDQMTFSTPKIMMTLLITFKDDADVAKFKRWQST